VGTFTFEATPTEAQLRATVRRANRRALMLVRGLGAVLVIWGLAGFLDAQFAPPVAAGLVVLGVVAVLFAPGWKVRRVMPATVAKLGRPSSYRIDDAGIWTGNDLAESSMRWPMISSIEELSPADVVLARLGAAMVVPIPVNGLAPAVRAALVTFMHAHAGAADIPPPPPPAPTTRSA
jgi:hypothetical protein